MGLVRNHLSEVSSVALSIHTIVAALVARAVWKEYITLNTDIEPRTMLSFGTLPLNVNYYREGVLGFLPDNILFQWKAQRVVTRCNVFVMENGTELETDHQKRSLNLILKVFFLQLRDYECEAKQLSDLNRLYFCYWRLMVLGLHFLKEPEDIDPSDTILIYMTATKCIELYEQIDKVLDLTPHITLWGLHGMLLASYTLLRLLKGPFVQYVDSEHGKSLLLQAVARLKRMSVYNNDLAARCSTALAQLWTSDKAFKDPDGKPSHKLRLRTRLASSVIFDSIWWWREEFGEMKGAYTSSKKPEISRNTGPEYVPGTEMSNDTVFQMPQPNDPYPFLDDQLLAGFGQGYDWIWNFPDASMQIPGQAQTFGLLPADSGPTFSNLGNVA